MFVENTGHFQPELFDVTSTWHPRYSKEFEKSWALVFYREVFCQIDEEVFKDLYSQDNGRPNAPINVLVSLELLKHLFNYSDLQLLEQYQFNVLFRASLGIRDFNSPPIAIRTIYNFRARLTSYMEENPEKGDLIAVVFRDLTEHFIAVAEINTSEQRADSTQIMPNIKRNGRLSLGFEVLHKAVRSLPEEILPEELKVIIKPGFKNDFIYRSAADATKSKLQIVIDLCGKLVKVAEENNFAELESVLLVKRFLEEQASFDNEAGVWVVKDGKELDSNCLQSAHDPDATFRRKGNEEYVGYVANLSETCDEDNPVQMITDYSVDKNNVHDTTLLNERLEEIKETGAEEIYVDGGYYNEEVINNAKEVGIDLHFTNMTGIDPHPEKLSLADFVIEGDKITACPQGLASSLSYCNMENGTITAHFDIEQCSKCPHYDNCPTRKGAKSAVVVITSKALLAAQIRKSIEEDQKVNTSKRAAIEGTNSALKRCGANDIRVRTLIKTRMVVGLKVTSRNIRQLWRYFINDFRRNPKGDRSVQNEVLATA
jgi:hypothetical protein